MIPLITQRIKVSLPSNDHLKNIIVNGNFGIFILEKKKVIYFNYVLKKYLATFSSFQ